MAFVVWAEILSACVMRADDGKNEAQQKNERRRKGSGRSNPR